MHTLALDPGLNMSGVALFDASGTLVRCDVLRNKSHKGDDIGFRVCWMQAAIAHWTADAEILEVVAEWPQVYRAGKSKGDPNDLLPLAAVVGAVLAFASPVRVRTFKPREWIGNVPKVRAHADAFDSARGVRIMSRLTEAERALVPCYHDAVDAVGIGLYALDRLKPTRILPGAT